MKIDKLIVGKRYKSYRELCKELEIKATGGRSKQYHLKELERWATFHREGNSYIIDSLKTIPVIKPKKANNTAYGDKIEDILLYTISNIEENSAFFSVSRALALVNLINEDYSKGRNNMHKTANDLNIDISCVSEFYTRTHQQFKSVFERSLKNMRMKGLIFWNTILVVVKNGEHQEATKEEIEHILETEEQVLRSLGLKSVKDAVVTNMWSEFNTMVNTRLRKSYGITYYYNAYNISINRNGVQRAVNELEYKELSTSLNLVACNRTFDNAKKRHSKKEKLIGWYKEEIKDNYLDNFKLLIDTFIKIQPV